MKTHSFLNGLYRVEFADRIDGICDVPGGDDTPLTMVILTGDDLRAFHSALHEGLHAHGVPDDYLHDREGNAATWSLARFLWRRIGEMNLKKVRSAKTKKLEDR